MRGEGPDSREFMCMCKHKPGWTVRTTQKCVCQHDCVVVLRVCLYLGCVLLSVVISSGRKVNWFASCSPLFDPTACSAVSLFGNLWHADDRAVLMSTHTCQVFTEVQCKYNTQPTHLQKALHIYVIMYRKSAALICVLFFALFMVKAATVPAWLESISQPPPWLGSSPRACRENGTYIYIYSMYQG